MLHACACSMGTWGMDRVIPRPWTQQPSPPHTSPSSWPGAHCMIGSDLESLEGQAQKTSPQGAPAPSTLDSSLREQGTSHFPVQTPFSCPPVFQPKSNSSGRRAFKDPGFGLALPTPPTHSPTQIPPRALDLRVPGLPLSLPPTQAFVPTDSNPRNSCPSFKYTPAGKPALPQWERLFRSWGFLSGPWCSPAPAPSIAHLLPRWKQPRRFSSCFPQCLITS